jgi:uncharacterized membrane protein
MLQTLVFFHILAVTMLFSGSALDLVALALVHRAATVADVRAATLNVPVVGPLMGLGALLLIAAGITMVYVGGFGWNNPWINVTLVLTLILAINGPITNGKGMERIRAMSLSANDGPIGSDIVRARSHAFLNFSIIMSACELIAALFVMTTKPDLVGSLVAAVVALVVAGVIAALVLRRASGAATTTA